MTRLMVVATILVLGGEGGDGAGLLVEAFRRGRSTPSSSPIGLPTELAPKFEKY